MFIRLVSLKNFRTVSVFIFREKQVSVIRTWRRHLIFLWKMCLKMLAWIAKGRTQSLWSAESLLFPLKAMSANWRRKNKSDTINKKTLSLRYRLNFRKWYTLARCWIWSELKTNSYSANRIWVFLCFFYYFETNIPYIYFRKISLYLVGGNANHVGVLRRYDSSTFLTKFTSHH